MTFKEQFDFDYPDHKNKDIPLFGCPFDYGYEASHPCKDHTQRNLRHCRECWNRQMPSLKAATASFGNHSVEVPYSGRTPIEYVDTAEFANTDPHILDSGERRQFETGAVRDIQEGKGRCDLMPLEVLCKYFKKPIFGLLVMFLKDGNTARLYECIRLFSSYYGEETNTTTDCTMFLEVAKHFEEGAKKYGENNWQKGLPVNCYIDSAARHYLKWLRGDNDEPHDRAFVWNLLCCIWEVDFSPRAKRKVEVPYMEKHIAHGYIPVVDIDSLPNLRPIGEKVSLEDCPIGPFDFNGVLGLKTEYTGEVYTIVGGEHMSVNDSDTVQPLEVI